MSATAPDMPACQRPGFVYAIQGTDRLTWACVAATLASAGLIALSAYWTMGCGPSVVLVLLDNGQVLECRP